MMNASPQIVVTGAAGFIGRRVAARLAAAGAAVVGVDRAPKPEGMPAGVEYRCGELGKEIPKMGGDSILVHLAWNMERGNAPGQAESAVDFGRLLESRGWDVEELCRLFGVFPILIGHAAKGQTMWGSGVEQILLGWQTLRLNPLLRKIEQSVKKQLMLQSLN